jgi:hypothetical protein
MKMLPGMDGDLTPQARAVLRAFTEAQASAIGFLLSTGVFPEISESSTERLHRIVRDLAGRHFNQKRIERKLRAAIQGCIASPRSRDQVESALNALLDSEAIAAYIFGLAAGLSLTSLDDHLRR